MFSSHQFLDPVDISTNDIEVPNRSPERPRMMRIDMDALQHKIAFNIESSPHPDDDISSAEYKLQGSHSPRESIFSLSPDVQPCEENQESPSAIHLDDLTLDDISVDDFLDAEICTITDVVSYKHLGGNAQVHIVTL